MPTCVCFVDFHVSAEASAGAQVHGTGSSHVEGVAIEILDATNHTAGDAVEAETGSTPVTPRSPASKKVKAKVWRKAKARQPATGCWEFNGPSSILHLPL